MLLQMLQMYDAVTGAGPAPAHNSADYLHLLAEIEKRAFADRGSYLGDPDFTEVPVSRLLGLA